MPLVFFSLPLFLLLLFFFSSSFFSSFLLADDGAVLVQAAICGPLDVSKQIAVDQLLAMRLQDMVGCPVIMRIGIDRIDSPSRRSGAPVLVPYHPLDGPLPVLLVVLIEQVSRFMPMYLAMLFSRTSLLYRVRLSFTTSHSSA